jgi:hypothetical protein
VVTGRDEGADRNRQVDVAARGEATDRAAIGAAPHGLELFDDLERADLRGAGDRSRRERGTHDVGDGDIGTKTCRHTGHQVVDAGVRLEGAQLLDLDRAVLGDAAQVVASEVDDHDVLGAVLRARAQRQRLAAVLGGSGAPRPGALDRAGLDACAAPLQEPLR